MKKQKTYPRRSWTEQEDNYLIKKYLSQSTAITAKRLNRSVESIKHRAARLGLNHYLDNMSARIVSKCFNVDLRVIKRWIEKYDLPVDRIKDSTRYSIDPVLFWKWAENHKDIINWSKYERRSIAPEPAWVASECRNYKNANTMKRITKEDIATVKRMIGKGYSFEDIAKELKRSIYSIEHIVRKLKD